MNRLAVLFIQPPQRHRSTLFPYTTLFRSRLAVVERAAHSEAAAALAKPVVDKQRAAVAEPTADPKDRKSTHPNPSHVRKTVAHIYWNNKTQLEIACIAGKPGTPSTEL